jgi:WhiB family redox-sensing transcriptional regulator
MTTTATPPPRPEDRPEDPRPAFERIAAAWLVREVDGGKWLDPSELARQVSVTPRTAAATLAALRASRERDPGCSRVRMLLARDRIQAAFVAAELRGDTRLDAAALAREAGVSTTVARQWLRTFRAARHSDPTLANLRGEPAEHRPATPQQLAGLQAAYARGGRPQPERRHDSDRAQAAPVRPAPAPGGGRLAWISQAACRDQDPELFFPERGHARQGTAAKQVCAACPVQGPCRDLAVKAASGRNDDHGIFGGTKPHERTALRDNVPFDHHKAWLTDRAQAQQAHQLAVEVGPQQAASQLGTYASTLRRAWDRWGLDYPGRPRTSLYARDPEHAQRAFRLAEELGSIPAVARQLGASRPALRAGWERFGLGQPDTACARQAQQAPRVARLDAGFLALNPTSLGVRAAGPAGLAARVRRAEQEATLGYRVTTELTAENRWRSVSARAWAVGQRARHAQQRAHGRSSAGERSPDRDRSGLERSPGRSGRERDGDQDADRPGDLGRRRVERGRDDGGER